MDLNDLYHRRGVSLLMARNAACDNSRDAHAAMAGAYAASIRAIRRQRLGLVR
jgi:hypothetical protein